jgi:membrane fusion protein, multidrug efflux system
MNDSVCWSFRFVACQSSFAIFSPHSQLRLSSPARTALLILFAVAVISMAGCSPQEVVKAEVVRPVKTMVVTSGVNSNTRRFPGTVDATNRVQLAFQVSGLLVSLPVKEGQKVAKGDVIGEIRQDEFRARLTALEGQLDQARAALRALLAGERPEERMRREADVRSADSRLANARAEFGRNQRLIEARAVSKSEFERTETAYKIAQEDLQSARQLLEIGSIAREEDIDAKQAAVRGLEGRVVEAQLQLDDCTLRAPYDGVIAQRFVEQGQNVRAKEPIVKFQDVDEVEISVDVPETVMAANLQAADIIQLSAEFVGAPGLQFPVRVTEMAQRADATTQTFNVRVAMKQPTELNVLPGMSATVTIVYRRASILGDRMLIPIEAVAQTPEGKQIAWLLQDDNSVGAVPVEIGETMGGEVEVVKGLAPGDRIVVAGVRFLRESMQVRDLGDALGERS